MKAGNHNLLICDCEGTMALNGKRIGKACGATAPADIASHLCRSQTGRFADALRGGVPLAVACTQEAPLFRELAEEARYEGELKFFNIRELAGWTTDKAQIEPKIAALVADRLLDVAPAGSITVRSDGVCLVYGEGQEALEVARKLQGRLSVTVLLTSGDDVIPPGVADVAIYRGRIVKASGHFGQFEVTVDGYAPVLPSSRDALQFMMSRDGARSQCNLILDMSGGDPLLASAERRDGYVRVDPRDRVAVATAMFEIADMAGEFEKPLYVDFSDELCAHSRNGREGCRRCLDVCPAAAITPAGDHVAIQPVICGGCGLCAGTCPTGAAGYALPRRADLLTRIRTLASAYLGAGGKQPVLLIHDERHGAELIGLSARYGRGLPARVVPLGLSEIGQVGHEALAAALVSGFCRAVVLSNPNRADDMAGLDYQIRLANSLCAGLGLADGDLVNHVSVADPDKLDEALWALEPGLSADPRDFRAVGSKRDVARTVLGLLHGISSQETEVVALPEQAPYGRVRVDGDACTLCLACVGTCPTSALIDNPDQPQLRFVEAACIQCGLCRNTCPESAITLEPRYNFSPAALSPVTLHEEEPFHCIRCGKPFGTASTIERIAGQLAGKHSMFRTEDAQALIRMCDDCRIRVTAEQADNPFALGERPRTRTTEDYLERRAGNGRDLTEDDFLIDD